MKTASKNDNIERQDKLNAYFDMPYKAGMLKNKER